MEVNDQRLGTSFDLTRNEKDYSTLSYYGVYTVISVYCVILLIGFFPNSLVLYLIFTRKLLRERYIMIASISGSHILFCILALPLSIVYRVTGYAGVARACETIICCCVGVTSFTMSVTAIRRAFALSEKFRYKIGMFSFKNKVKSIVVTWVIAIGVSIPFVFEDCVEKSPFSQIAHNCSGLVEDIVVNNNKVNITEQINFLYNETITNPFDSNEGSDGQSTSQCFIYGIILALNHIYILPIVSFILQGYGWISIRKRPNQALWEKEIMLTKQHLLMASGFHLCWTPLTIVNLLGYGSTQDCDVVIASQLIALVFVIDNPVIYCIFNPNMKQEFMKWLKAL